MLMRCYGGHLAGAVRFGILAALTLLGTGPSRAASAAPDPFKELVGRSAIMALHLDAEAELDQGIAGLGYQAIQQPRDLTAEGQPTYRLDVLAANGQSVLVAWRLERQVDKVKGEWKLVGAQKAKIGSESSFTDQCAGNQKGKPIVTFLFHEGGAKGKPAKDVLSVFRLDRQAGKLEKLSGKPPACTTIEDVFSD